LFATLAVWECPVSTGLSKFWTWTRQSDLEFKMKRRDFLGLSILLGLATSTPIRGLSGFAWAFQNDNLYDGKLVELVNQLFRDVVSGALSEEQFLIEVRKRYSDIDVKAELEPFLHVQNQEILQIHKTKMRVDGQKVHLKLQLFFLGAGQAHPPHAHDGLVSRQTHLSGKTRLIEYERVATHKHALELNPVTNRILSGVDVFETTQHHHNVHWFGALERSIIFNLNVVRKPLAAAPDQGMANGESRIYLDPTGEVSKGIVMANILDREEAHARFANSPLPEG
jgi:hypothetical protein